MTPEQRDEAIALYDRFTHEGLERRTFMARMAAIVGSVAAAEALIGAIGASPAAAALTDASDKRLKIARGKLAPGNPLSGYVAVKKGLKRPPLALVIHENRGLNAHIEDVARRFAMAGFMAVAPDLLSPGGGTPSDEDRARDAIGKLDLGASVGQAVDLMTRLKAMKSTNGKAGIVGFCWGGAFVNRVAVTAGGALDAGVAYYGPAPDPSEAAKVEAPLMLHHAGLDTRVAQTLWPWVAALRAAGKRVTYFNYEGANHAFNNDTSAERYDKAAAELAWKRTLRFFRKHLRG